VVLNRVIEWQSCRVRSSERIEVFTEEQRLQVGQKGGEEADIST